MRRALLTIIMLLAVISMNGQNTTVTRRPSTKPTTTTPKTEKSTPKGGRSQAKSGQQRRQATQAKRAEEIPYEEEVATLKPGESYSRVHKFGSNGLAIVELERPYGKKYGLIDKEGNIVVPLMYDKIAEKETWSSTYPLAWAEHQLYWSVIKKTKDGWRQGCIDANGKLVIPLNYEQVPPKVMDTEKLLKVKKNGKWGCLNLDGSERLPCIYDEMDDFREGNPAFVKKDDKYAFVDALGNFITPFCYSTVRSCSSNRAPVSINGKYGYIDWLGKEIIPLEYEYAFPFYGGLGGVVKNGKLGFIDRHGKVVIPFEYDRDTKEWGLRYMMYNVIALIKKNGKYGAINKKNEIVLPFVYSYDGGRTSLEVAPIYIDSENSSRKALYMDYGGNIYNYWNKDIERTDSVLASKGIAEGQHRLGYKSYREKKYDIASDLFTKAAKQNHAPSQYMLGLFAEFGYGHNKSYEDAAK